jgi:hypothetical protein
VIQSEALHAALSALVAGRVWPVMFPQSPLPTWPAIRYTPVGGTVYPDACGGGDGTLDDVRVQIDSAAETFVGARTLNQQVRAAMMAFTPPAVPEGPPIFDFDPELRVHRAIQDFVLYPSSPAVIP